MEKLRISPIPILSSRSTIRLSNFYIERSQKIRELLRRTIMGEQTKNMLIGVFIIAACTLIVGLIMFLRPSVGDAKQTLYVRFSNINKVNIGTRVLFAGKAVGQVTKIDPIYHARETQ